MFDISFGKFEKQPLQLVSECWYCGDFHITSEWVRRKGVEFLSPCQVGHSPRTKVEAFDTICLTPPVLPQEDE